MKFCFFGFHDWKCYQVFNYIDNSYSQMVKSHVLCFICSRCKKIKEKTMYGDGNLNDEDIEKIKDL